MEAINKLEGTLAGLYEKLPNLPKNGRRWLGRNAWWLVLILAVLYAISVLSQIGGVFAQLAIAANYGSAYDGFDLIVSVITIVESAVLALLYFTAISPLKAMRRRGWNLVFLAQVVGFILAVVIGILTTISYGSFLFLGAYIFGFVIGLLIFAVGLYFVFQIRAEFKTRSGEAAEAELVTPAKKA